MPLTSDMVGLSGPVCSERLEDRWVMNYAASVLDRNATYFDTLDGRRAPAHPAYLSHQEWEAIAALHEVIEGLTPEERNRGVHSHNDTRILRPLHSGDVISCVAKVETVERRRSGGRLSVRIDTTDATGELVATSLTRTVFRGVEVDGPDAGQPADAEVPDDTDAWPDDPTRVERISVDSLAAHIFSECARDYNPIHTDIAAATKAGLPGLILHGTGTFAIALSSLTNHEAAGDPTLVRRFGGRLGAMVLCPSVLRLEVRTHGRRPERLRFDVVTEDGGRAIAGYAELGTP